MTLTSFYLLIVLIMFLFLFWINLRTIHMKVNGNKFMHANPIVTSGTTLMIIDLLTT